MEIVFACASLKTKAMPGISSLEVQKRFTARQSITKARSYGCTN